MYYFKLTLLAGFHHPTCTTHNIEVKYKRSIAMHAGNKILVHADTKCTGLVTVFLAIHQGRE